MYVKIDHLNEHFQVRHDVVNALRKTISATHTFDILEHAYLIDCTSANIE